MEKEMSKFISENKLNPFEPAGKIRNKQKSMFATADAKSVFNKTLDKLSSNFVFSDTENLWSLFSFSPDFEIIKLRQEFFSKIKKQDNGFLKELSKPRNWWKPKYGILAVSEDEKTFSELQKLNIPCMFLNSQYDLEGLDNYDLIQAIDCDNFSSVLESLPQSVFLDSADDAYLERYLETLSGWQKNIEILQTSKILDPPCLNMELRWIFDIVQEPHGVSRRGLQSTVLDKNETNEEVIKIVNELAPLMKLLENKQLDKISREEAENKLNEINSEIENEIAKLSISGTALMSMLSRGKLPEELAKIVETAIKKTNLPEYLFTMAIPVSLDELEVEKLIKEQNASEYISLAEAVKRKSSELREIPEKLKRLSELLIYFDFCAGISQSISENSVFPELGSEFYFSEAENIFLDNAQPVSFSLDSGNKCSILTGANSGGKTTLLEHVIQLITFFQLGLPVSGKVKVPIFSGVYYFAKNKGSASKGAFETLLTQMASIKPGNQTLILADEIESVTEPGIAGRIIAATADFFTSKGCFLIIATHLGQEVQKNMPKNSRIDGIEAKGLDENFELIVDHNPVLGRLASSTPELIIEKMANVSNEEYFKFLNEKIRKNKLEK